MCQSTTCPSEHCCRFGPGNQPVSGVGLDNGNFSIRWLGYILPRQTGWHTFYLSETRGLPQIKIDGLEMQPAYDGTVTVPRFLFGGQLSEFEVVFRPASTSTTGGS